MDEGRNSFVALANRLTLLILMCCTDDFIRFGVMDNIKANVPRTAYKGIVSFSVNGGNLVIHIVPASLKL